MAINPLLLIAAPMLQDYLVDTATGLPLANGTITLYQDTSRTTFKNWYYQTGTAGAYTYITLPNPMTLSGVGTITDGNGNDVIPFYYPFSELDNTTSQSYYIVVQNSNGQQQFTRQNFPYVPRTPSVVQNPTLRNYLINNVFWRNLGSKDVSNVTSATIAPDQHDGFSMPDIQFLKDVTGATDTVTFTPFTPGDQPGQVLTNDITPQYYLNFNCTAAHVGETLKCIQIPISLHIKTLENVTATLVIHAQNISGNNQLTLTLVKFLGSGVTSPPLTPLTTLTLNSNWQKYTTSFTFPLATGLPVDGTSGGDDAWYLQIGYPLGVVFQTNFTKPQLYLSQTIPDNNFDTYDQIDSIINTPRTGDSRISLNSFSPFGWVPANDGTIGSLASTATNRNNADTWPLYKLIWNSVPNFWAPVIGGKGTSDISDFTSNKPITLTKQLGRVIAGLNAEALPSMPPGTSFTTNYNGGYAGDHNNLIFTVGNIAGIGLVSGSAVTVANTGGGSSLPPGLSANTVYYVFYITGATTVALAHTLEDAIAATNLIDLQNDSVGNCVISSALGSYIGNSTTTLDLTNVPPHVHGSLNTDFITEGTGANIGGGASYGKSSTTASAGGSGSPVVAQPFNNIQPTVLMNIFLKL